MKNSLEDLNNYLFEQLERLTDDSLDVDEEIKRSKAVATVAKNIVDNARLLLDAQMHKDEYYGDSKKGHLPKMLEGGKNE